MNRVSWLDAAWPPRTSWFVSLQGSSTLHLELIELFAAQDFRAHHLPVSTATVVRVFSFFLPLVCLVNLILFSRVYPVSFPLPLAGIFRAPFSFFPMGAP